MTTRVKKKHEVTTVQHLHRWKAADFAIRSGMFVCPTIPFGVIIGINWSDWFGENSNASTGWSIGMGFAMLLCSFIATIIGVYKKDEILKEKISPLLYMAILLAFWGFAFKMLASIMNEFGNYFLYFAASILGSFGCAETSQLWSSKWLSFYSKVAEDNALTNAGSKRKKAREQAIREAAEKEAKEHQAVE